MLYPTLQFVTLVFIMTNHIESHFSLENKICDKKCLSTSVCIKPSEEMIDLISDDIKTEHRMYCVIRCDKETSFKYYDGFEDIDVDLKLNKDECIYKINEFKKGFEAKTKENSFEEINLEDILMRKLYKRETEEQQPVEDFKKDTHDEDQSNSNEITSSAPVNDEDQSHSSETITSSSAHTKSTDEEQSHFSETIISSSAHSNSTDVDQSQSNETIISSSAYVKSTDEEQSHSNKTTKSSSKHSKAKNKSHSKKKTKSSSKDTNAEDESNSNKTKKSSSKHSKAKNKSHSKKKTKSSSKDTNTEDESNSDNTTKSPSVKPKTGKKSKPKVEVSDDDNNSSNSSSYVDANIVIASDYNTKPKNYLFEFGIGFNKTLGEPLKVTHYSKTSNVPAENLPPQFPHPPYPFYDYSNFGFNYYNPFFKPNNGDNRNYNPFQNIPFMPPFNPKDNRQYDFGVGISKNPGEPIKVTHYGSSSNVSNPFLIPNPQNPFIG